MYNNRSKNRQQWGFQADSCRGRTCLEVAHGIISYLQGFVCYLCHMLGVLVVVGFCWFFYIDFTEAVFPHVFLWWAYLVKRYLPSLRHALHNLRIKCFEGSFLKWIEKMIQLKTKQFFFPAKYSLHSSENNSSLTSSAYIALSDMQTNVLHRQNQLKLSKVINAQHSPRRVSPLFPCP